MNEMDVTLIISLLILISVIQLYLFYDALNRRIGMSFLEWFIGSENTKDELLKEFKIIVNNSNKKQYNKTFEMFLRFCDKIKKEIDDHKSNQDKRDKKD